MNSELQSVDEKSQEKVNELINLLEEEKIRFTELNQKLSETIYKYQRNTNLGFYLFLSTALVCVTYLLK
jgi:hypothetical protein